jgi:hypothetical protein
MLPTRDRVSDDLTDPFSGQSTQDDLGVAGVVAGPSSTDPVTMTSFLSPSFDNVPEYTLPLEDSSSRPLELAVELAADTDRSEVQASAAAWPATTAVTWWEPDRASQDEWDAVYLG